MNKKPFFLRIFSLLLILEPLIKITLLSVQTDFSLLHVASRGVGLDPINFFNFWLLFPLAGILLIKLNQYTFIAFVTVQVYSTIFHLSYEAYTWPYLSELPHMSSIFLLLLNIGFTLYILLPRTAMLFFDERRRWWERGSRFIVNQPCLIFCNGEKFQGNLDNVSYSGALVSCFKKIDIGSQIEIEFPLLNESFRLSSRIIRDVYSLDNVMGHGVKFSFPNTWAALRMRITIFKIDTFSLLPRFR